MYLSKGRELFFWVKKVDPEHIVSTLSRRGIKTKPIKLNHIIEHLCVYIFNETLNHLNVKVPSISCIKIQNRIFTNYFTTNMLTSYNK